MAVVCRRHRDRGACSLQRMVSKQPALRAGQCEEKLSRCGVHRGRSIGAVGSEGKRSPKRHWCPPALLGEPVGQRGPVTRVQATGDDPALSRC